MLGIWEAMVNKILSEDMASLHKCLEAVICTIHMLKVNLELEPNR
jgi:hypothetical protein